MPVPRIASSTEVEEFMRESERVQLGLMRIMSLVSRLAPERSPKAITAYCDGLVTELRLQRD